MEDEFIIPKNHLKELSLILGVDLMKQLNLGCWRSLSVTEVRKLAQNATGTGLNRSLSV